MYDRYKRKINYLRISVTDRCNLRCRYCMPEEGITLLDHKDILSFEEIAEIVTTAAELGITKVRITGGEPLVRKGIVSLVRMISEIEGIEDFGLTTNGISLAEFAFPLAEAGLHRVNISLDTMDPDKYRFITRGGDLHRVLEGIETAKKAGFKPIKLNCVVENSSQEPDALSVREFALKNDLEVRFIHQMDLETGCFSVVEGGMGGDCHSCNRIRLTASGYVKPCLFNDLEFNIHELGIREAIEKAVNFKPEKGSCNLVNRFHNIGG
jgi:GTP 3',8-cyclase